METHGIDRNRPAVGVVGGICDELIIERQEGPFVEADRIVGFQYFFFPVVELAIAYENP